MASTSVPSTLRFCTNFTPFLPAPNIAHESGLRMKMPHANLSLNISQPIHFRNLFTKTTHAAVACCADDSGPREEYRALETVLKLYEAIKNKNVNELSEIIAEECSCISNFVSACQPYLGKKQVMAFFSSLMKYLGNNIEIVVQKTLDEGMVVGVSWKLEWKKVPLHLGKGFSFYTCHVYHGKVMIRNVEMFLEPILHMEPLRLVRILNQQLITLVMAAIDKLNPQFKLKKRARKTIILLFILLFLAALVCSFK